ncbi:aspartate--tRNA(Asn) ligase [Candidatus Hikarchaeum yamanae]|uniref:aspartate--tRNA(Asn) ligase n=1 Tax=Candidatus Hikarchaeum yamanae TaxID=2675326 RepID=UPI0039E86649|tara:strand:- start:77189 stop:78490 length:1302 start_codon:yes stop_codon:yes gene_type:complete
MYDRTLINASSPGDEITVVGWVHEVRDLGGLTFLLLRDRSGILQVKFEKETLSSETLSILDQLYRESVVLLTGMVVSEKRAPTGIELVPKTIEILALSDPNLPLDPSGKVTSELSTRLDKRCIDLRRIETRAIFEIRSEIQRSIRQRFYDIDCIEINTPKIVATGTEGGTDLFPIAYFGKEAFMNQSPQLFKQLVAGGGIERVFEIGPIFRAEEHNTTRHLNEATSIDFEAAFIDHEMAMEVAEDIISIAYHSVSENCPQQLHTLSLDGLSIPETPFPRISYDSAIEIANGSSDLSEPLEWGDDLSTQAERIIGSTMATHYFITDWPSEIKPFYIQNHDESPEISKGFDLMHPSMELVSGGQREHRYDSLIDALQNQGLNPIDFEFYVDMFRYGMPPHSGWGMGADRLVMSMLQLDNVREVVLFPRDRNRLAP